MSSRPVTSRTIFDGRYTGWRIKTPRHLALNYRTRVRHADIYKRNKDAGYRKADSETTDQVGDHAKFITDVLHSTRPHVLHVC